MSHFVSGDSKTLAPQAATLAKLRQLSEERAADRPAATIHTLKQPAQKQHYSLGPILGPVRQSGGAS